MKFTLPIDKLLREDQQLSMRFCDYEACEEEGIYPAPKNRAQLRDFYWFCLDHVREYNARWNYYAGMNENEIELDRNHASKWERPTWPFGQKLDQQFGFHCHTDPLGLFHEHHKSNSWFPEGSPEQRALRVLDLSWPVSEADLKKRYKQLAKACHPDINKDDPQATEAFKKVNEAYVILKKALGK